jgi:5-formyltetrahydrofolate cyclo-ligase
VKNEKAELRRKIRLQTETANSTEAKSRQILTRLFALDVFCDALRTGRLMSFVPLPSEVDTIPLFAGHEIAVPCCVDNEIVPFRIVSLSELEPGCLGIREPRESVRQDPVRRVEPADIAVVLVPGLAFDVCGNRLGRGKGYYDRFLRSLPKTVQTIGLAFDRTVYETVPHGENDYPVHIIVTENRLIKVETECFDNSP